MKLLVKEKKINFLLNHEIAEKCFLKFEKVMKKLSIDLSKYHFIEPSAGSWLFLLHLTKQT